MTEKKKKENVVTQTKQKKKRKEKKKQQQYVCTILSTQPCVIHFLDNHCNIFTVSYVITTIFSSLKNNLLGKRRKCFFF
ncbi:hypothetical protein [Arthrobacter sp. SX1312]|uniref:hypothetical protein n=1 Tax=Arthrobacter sp. SX1312 TaxID=2058896 RepID=UPI0015E20FA0|nr:hypothetical protein [Arthrobacter sp. SX1312]